MMYGTIFADIRDAGRLEDMGVELGPYVDDGFTDCCVTDGALERLDPWWGIFVWELHEGMRVDQHKSPANSRNDSERNEG